MKEQIKPIKFPRDHSVHDHIIEWWYFNGHLQDKKGNRYAFMSCLFRADVKNVKIPFLSKIPAKTIHFYHAVMSDIGQGITKTTVDNISVVSDDSFPEDRLFINHTTPITIAGYVNRVLEEVAPSVFHLKDEQLDLTMASTKQPLLEGGTGYIDVRSKKSYYYSLTNLTTSGQIKVGDEWMEITGKSWMDHQWANTAYTQDKWTWFSIQLDDSREIVCYEYDDGKNKTYLADISNTDGQTEHYDDVIIEPLKRTWTSPKTKASYPLDWRIQVKAKAIDLEVRSLMSEQELIFGSINYFEGPLAVSGTIAGNPVKGDGFMELVGYPSEYSNLRYAQDKLSESAKEIYNFAKKNIFK